MEEVSASPDQALADFNNTLTDVRKAIDEIREIRDSGQIPKEAADALVFATMALHDSEMVLREAEKRRTLEADAFAKLGHQRFQEGARWCQERHDEQPATLRLASGA